VIFGTDRGEFLFPAWRAGKGIMGIKVCGSRIWSEDDHTFDKRFTEVVWATLPFALVLLAGWPYYYRTIVRKPVKAAGEEQ